MFFDPHVYLGNDWLGSLSGLENLSYIGGNLTIVDNPRLAGLRGLTPGILEIGGDIYIKRNIANKVPALSTCEVNEFVDSIRLHHGAVFVADTDRYQRMSMNVLSNNFSCKP